MDKTPSPSTGPTRRLFGALMVTLLALPARAQPAPAGSEELALREATADASLGTIWSQSENGWTGTWRRRGNTGTFDAEWSKGSSRHYATLTIRTRPDGSLRIERHDRDGTVVDYTGTVDAKGRIHGTGKVRQTGHTYPWTATIQGYRSTAPKPTAGMGLGQVWHQNENGWSGVWTRRGNTNVFDGVWTQGSSRHLGTMTITMGSNGAVRIYRKDGNGIEVDYVGTMSARGQVNGTAKVRQTGARYAWTATVQ